MTVHAYVNDLSSNQKRTAQLEKTAAVAQIINFPQWTRGTFFLNYTCLIETITNAEPLYCSANAALPLTIIC